MKKIQLSIVALIATQGLLFAGGDIQEPTVYETADSVAIQAVPVEPIVVKEPVVIPVPIEKKVVNEKTSINGFYAGLGLTAVKYDTNCGCNSKKSGVDKTAGLLGRVGYDFNKFLGLEVRGMITTLKDDGGKVKHLGAFAKPMYPLTEDINTYALVGLAKTTTQGTLRRTDVTGLAFGLGFEYDLSADHKKEAKYDREFDGMADQEKGFGVFADYERLYYKSGSPDLDALTVGVTYDF